MSIGQVGDQFNTYDILSTFLPGAITVVGIGAPHPDAASYFRSIGLASLVVWGIVAFAVGLLLQIPAGVWFSGESRFSRRLTRLIERDENDDKVSRADAKFLEDARGYFNFGSDFKDWARLYRAVLTELENNQPSRAIRLQTLFLAMRGLVVATLLLAATTGVYLLFSVFSGVTLYPPDWMLAAAVVVLFVLSGLAASRTREFNDAAVSYMIAEFRILYGDDYDEQNVFDVVQGE